MKRILLAALCILAAGTLQAKSPRLSFDEKGEFRIMHLTDCHMQYEKPELWNRTLARIDTILKAEHPDMVVFTGDIVTGARSLRVDMWHVLIDKMDSYKIPYVIVYGNHDAEGFPMLKRPEMSSLVTAGKYALNTLNEKGELADMRIPVHAHKDGKPAFDIYVLDSHDYTETMGFDKNYGKYAWFTHAQVDWLRNECVASTKGNGGVNIPSMAFFHIPLFEYGQAADKGPIIGVRGEREACGTINSGMFAAMFETGNVMAVFAGHDHNNNYIVNHCGIVLGYGGFSGDDTTYNDLAHGLRMIVVKEGSPEFTTWIHDEDGRIRFFSEYRNKELKQIKK